ncbi:MAG TPA: cytochrome b N-terminal domain-containing protein [Casimicrobiaceae bacterium]|nr:cytochrome b N-terminal domain-containing protein [Casimicrobiaceae bacterium]
MNRTAPASRSLRTTLQRGLQRIEHVFDTAFGMPANPWRHLGALAFYLFWIVVATGAYLYAAFDTSVAGAYASVQRITDGAWPLSGFARTLHRYASDAFAVVVLLHLAREWLNGHARGFRWFSWVSGVPLLWLAYASGLGGYWLVWDRLAQFSLVATTEWLDALPLFGEPLARNFITGASVSNRLFSLLIFLHIGIPLALLLGMWIHVQRISAPRTQPPRELGIGLACALTLLAVARPATSDVPADTSRVPAQIAIDWFYQAIHPLFYATSGTTLWLLAGAATLALAALPWLGAGARRNAAMRRGAAARVDLANCNGCGRCFADCPYAAVTLEPRSDGRPLPREAVVDPDLCAACGICAGACPSSTPFRAGDTLRAGIDLPGRPITAVRDELERGLAALRGKAKVVVFGCECAADAAALRASDTSIVPLACAAQLPPSFVEYALRGGADGVLIAGCRDGDCAYRFGTHWTAARIAGAREPHLRATVPRERVHTAHCGPFDGDALRTELARLRRALHALPAAPLAALKRKERIHE